MAAPRSMLLALMAVLLLAGANAYSGDGTAYSGECSSSAGGAGC